MVEVSDATGYNNSVKSNTGTCMYLLTTFIDFRLINLSASSLLLSSHLIGTRFIPLDFMILLFIGIQAFLERILFTYDIAYIFHKCPFGLVIAYLRVSGSPAFAEKYVLHYLCILSSSCSTIGITLVSSVTL